MVAEINFNITERKFNLFSEIQRVSDRNTAQNKITKRIELHAQKLFLVEEMFLQE